MAPVEDCDPLADAAGALMEPTDNEIVEALTYSTAGPCRDYWVCPVHVEGTHFAVVKEGFRIDLCAVDGRWRVEFAHLEVADQVMHALGELEGVYGIADGRPIAEWLDEHRIGRAWNQKLGIWPTRGLH